MSQSSTNSSSLEPICRASSAFNVASIFQKSLGWALSVMRSSTAVLAELPSVRVV